MKIGPEFVEIPWPEWQYDGFLGRGGFGEVYRVRREEFGNTSYAALKIIRIPSDESEIQDLEDDGVSAATYFNGIVEDYVKEISLMESLKGASNIVSIEDYRVVEKKGSPGWTIYIRMELLTNLKQYRKQHIMTVEEVLKLGCDICTALEACQKKKIVHRDIKPSNILVSEFGDFKLGDFGISRSLSHTMSGLSKKGTDLYMAPEVYRGDKYNATVDIYSLGIVLYSLLNHNRLPFFPKAPDEVTTGNSKEAFSRRITGEVFPDPESGGKEIGNVLRKACNIDPGQRYQTAAEMKNAIRNCCMMENSEEPILQGSIDDSLIHTGKTAVEEELSTTRSTLIINKDDRDMNPKKTGKNYSVKFFAAVIVLAVACVSAVIIWNYVIKKNSEEIRVSKTESIPTLEPTFVPEPTSETTPTPAVSPVPTIIPSPVSSPVPSPTPISEQPLPNGFTENNTEGMKLSRLHSYVGDLDVENIMDNMENAYVDAFVAGSNEESATYDIGMRYRTLKGIVAVEKGDQDSDFDRDRCGYIQVYGDGTLLWEDTKINTSSKPYEMSVDISEVTDLKIVMSGFPINLSWDHISVIFANVTLQ